MRLKEEKSIFVEFSLFAVFFSLHFLVASSEIRNRCLFINATVSVACLFSSTLSRVIHRLNVYIQILIVPILFYFILFRTKSNFFRRFILRLQRVFFFYNLIKMK